MKTHGYVSVTLSLKNMLLGAPINDYKAAESDKFRMHKGPHGEPNDIASTSICSIWPRKYIRTWR